MTVVAVASPKGGVGKSTLSTNIAGWFARQGHKTALGDMDRQQSSSQWLALRPPQLPPILPWTSDDFDGWRLPAGATHGVLDTPAGLHGKRLDAVMKVADRILVPLQPSMFDIQATYAFLQAVREHRRADRVQLALVGMRVKEGTISQDRLQEFVGTLDAPMLTTLRDTQNYVHLAARGATLWDVAPGRVERDVEQWAPIIEWMSA